MAKAAGLAAFEARLGHRFADEALLVRALTHPSLSSPTRSDNQRLEFLGDRVLGLAVAETLLAEDDAAPEGILAPRYNALVRRETLAAIAEDIGLGEVIRLGRSETMSGGRRKAALLADALEAVLAAVYLDAGFGKAKEVVLTHWKRRIATVDEDARDAKTTLQERVQATGAPPPEYVEVGRTGPDHAPRFTIEARLSDGRSARAEAGSKRAAEQAAAEALLTELGGA